MLKSIKSIFFSALLLPALSAHAAKVSGVVTNRASGDPISGATVIIGSFSGAGSADTTKTDAKGTYSFDGISVGFHTVIASMTGFQSNTANVNVTSNGGSFTANIALSAGVSVPSGTIRGTVKDDSTKEALKGATVILSHPAGRGGATAIDTVETDGEGRFTFAAVPAATGYIVTASLTGYSTATDNTVDVVNHDTTTVPLTLRKVPKPAGAIVGHVTAADTKQNLAGAMVILRKRTVNGTVTSWTPIDTLLTPATGFYAFRELAASTQTFPYSLVFSLADYVSQTSANVILGNNQTDTVNAALTKVVKGTMSIFVGLDSTGNAPLAGAAVAASLDGTDTTVYTGTTDAKGWVTFASVISGTYSVSANLTGFVSKVVSRTVTANEKDTGYVYLARATAQNSKSLSGLVRDADGKALAGVTVLFTANGNSGIVLSSTTTATGDYSFNGIPTSVASGVVAVNKDGYTEFSGAVTLSGAASFLNVTLKKSTSIAALSFQAGALRFQRNGNALSLEFPAASSAGRLSLYDARGGMLHTEKVPAGATRAAMVVSPRAGFLVLEQGAVVRKAAVPAR
jgi:hypothetical protein